jgi:hypothetical protein
LFELLKTRRRGGRNFIALFIEIFLAPGVCIGGNLGRARGIF